MSDSRRRTTSQPRQPIRTHYMAALCASVLRGFALSLSHGCVRVAPVHVAGVVCVTGDVAGDVVLCVSTYYNL